MTWSAAAIWRLDRFGPAGEAAKMANSGISVSQPDVSAEVLIVGGGLVGLTLGCALAGAGVTAAVIDRQDPAEMVGRDYDGRASAIAHASARVLRGIGV